MRLPAIRQKLEDWLDHPGFVPLLFLLISTLAYGLMIPWLHLYIDDWLWHWTWERMGSAGLVKYFATNRPVWGLLYQVTLAALYPNIVAYHIFALLVRWASGLASWWFFRLLWPNRPRTALIGGLLFLLYPGFALQPIALTYAHIFLVYIFFLLSLCFNLLALKNRKRFWIYTIIALALSLANLFMMEFYFTLEAARLFILWAVVSRETSQFSQRIKRTLLRWLPYLLAFISAVFWRAFIFKFQNYRYQFDLVGQLKAAPLQTAAGLAAQVGEDLVKVSLGAWWPAVERLMHLKLRLATSLVTLLVIAGIAVLVFVTVMLRRSAQPEREKRWPLETMALGLLVMLTAGWPFWLTGLSIQLYDFKSRFTLPFMIGVVIFFLGLIEWIKPRWVQAGLLALALGVAGGYHFQIANDFRIDWESDQQLFWQLAWRAPDIQPGTTLMLTDFPILYYNYATYSTEVASLYPKPEDYDNLPYFVFYVREMGKEVGGLVPNNPIQADNVTSVFNGNTLQALMVDFNLGHCVRLLDRGFDTADKTLSEPEQQGAALSDLRWVQVDQPDNQPNMRWFGKEPAHTWCYYFEKAELARQRGDWQTAARLGDEAAANGYTARDEMEKLVFIEAYAHAGDWEKALALSEGFKNEGKRPMLCLLWQRIGQQTAASEGKTRSIQTLSGKNICPRPGEE